MEPSGLDHSYEALDNGAQIVHIYAVINLFSGSSGTLAWQV